MEKRIFVFLVLLGSSLFGQQQNRGMPQQRQQQLSWDSQGRNQYGAQVRQNQMSLQQQQQQGRRSQAQQHVLHQNESALTRAHFGEQSEGTSYLHQYESANSSSNGRLGQIIRQNRQALQQLQQSRRKPL